MIGLLQFSAYSQEVTGFSFDVVGPNKVNIQGFGGSPLPVGSLERGPRLPMPLNLTLL